MTILDDLKKAAEAMRKPYKPVAPFDTVERHDGVALFKSRGRVVGWMNWHDFEAACAELEKRK